MGTLESGVIGSVVTGGVLTLLGRISQDRWMAKVKAEYDQKLEALKSTLIGDQKALQAKVDRSVFVSKTQFDTEFKAMQDVFKLVTDTWLQLGGILPTFDTRPANQTKAEREDLLWERWKRLMEPLQVFQTQMEVLSPFYPEELYVALNRCRIAASVNASMFQTTPFEMRDVEWMILWRQQVSEFDIAYKQCADIIRKRLERLSVIE